MHWTVMAQHEIMSLGDFHKLRKLARGRKVNLNSQMPSTPHKLRYICFKLENELERSKTINVVYG